MKRRLVLGAAFGVALTRPVDGLAQGGPGLRRVGVLEVASPQVTRERRRAYIESMRTLGWEEGRNVAYRFESADGREDRLAALAASLVEARMEVIVNSSAVSTRVLMQATKSIPIVMVTVVDPVGNGFVASLSRPGGNVTGLSNQQEDLLGKLVEHLRELAPGARRVAFLLNDKNPSHAYYQRAIRTIGKALGIETTDISASTASLIDAAVRRVVASGAQAVVVPADPLFASEAKALGTALAATRLPTAFGQRSHLAHGGLVSFGVDFVDNWRHAARYVDRILKGAKPADLPVEQPTRFELVVNRRTATSLGLRIPDTIRARADVVIE